MNTFAIPRFFKVNKPNMKLGFGIGLLLGGGVLGIKKAFKMADAINKDLEDIAEIHKERENKDTIMYPTESYNEDLLKGYGRLGRDVIITIGPWLATSIVGTGFVLSYQHDMSTSLELAAGALASVTSRLNSMTKELTNDIGEEEANKYRHGYEVKEVTVCDIDSKGLEKIEKKTVKAIDTDIDDPYSYIWDVSSPCYKSNPYLRRAFLDSMEEYGNGMLDARNYGGKVGYIYLSEIMNQMGIDIRDIDDSPEKKRAISHLGWTYDSRHPAGIGDGDGYVKIKDEDIYKFNPATGYYDKVTLLTFNCDGAIDWLVYDKRGRLEEGGDVAS